ncbi:hypothetical protein N9381_12965 [Paracoccaceae bacterium]|nr:hypothetical protein [Paracoccaceae bacterium]
MAFDGDFAHCFFFYETGQFAPGEYVVGLLAAIFFKKEARAKIVHHSPAIWNTQDIVSQKGGVAMQSKTGYAFIKQVMRSEKTVSGGEMLAHHYFHDFAYCDPLGFSGRACSRSGRSLGDWVKDRSSSGETNFCMEDAGQAIDTVLEAYREDAICIDEIDGLSLSFNDWHFNLRRSNSEPLVRLDIETKRGEDRHSDQVDVITELLGGTKG